MTLHALSNHTHDIQVEQLHDFFVWPKGAYGKLMMTRKSVIEILKQRKIHHTEEKVPVYDIKYEIDTTGKLIMKIFLSSNEEDHEEYPIGIVKPDKVEELHNILEGRSKVIIPKGTGSRIISDIVGKFHNDKVIDPFNGSGKTDIKPIPNFPIAQKDGDNTHHKNGVLRIGRPWNGADKIENKLQQLCRDKEGGNDILITGNELTDEGLSNLCTIVKEGTATDHRLFIVPTIRIINHPDAEILRLSYEKAYALSMNSEELTGSNNSSWNDIHTKNRSLLKGTTKNNIRLITHDDKGAYLSIHKEGYQIACQRSILGNYEGRDLIDKIYEYCPQDKKELLGDYINENISNTVGCGDTAYAGLCVATYNREEGKIDVLIDGKDTAESLKIEAYYTILFSQTLAYLSYHSKFSNFAQIEEIIGAESFQEIVRYINNFVYNKTEEFVNNNYEDKDFSIIEQ